MPDGEIRSYGFTGENGNNPGKCMYKYSLNCGLDWQSFIYPEGVASVVNYGRIMGGRAVMGASVKLPWSERYVTVVSSNISGKEGTYSMYSDIGPGDEAPKMVKVSDAQYIDLFQPIFLPNRKRIITSGWKHAGSGDYEPTVFISDDDGESFKVIALPCTPRFVPEWPHLGVRWNNNGSEPNIGILPDGRLMMLLRTSLDNFYVSYSSDGGDTWSESIPSRFHGTLTTPFILTLHDGRVLVFWNNTRPMSELNHDKTWPKRDEWVCSASGEDFFTNRDASHVAITEDGESYIGFRELLLNEKRGGADFRTGGSGDNSVHQFQAIELPFNKVLVCVGQNAYSRRTLIFDIDWLYEKKCSEDFKHGLSKVTTHMFVKSNPGSHHPQIPGHCAYNRTNGALLMPDPIGNYEEALHICRLHDPRLLNELQGVVWNFPKAIRGELKTSLYVAGEGIKLRLCDHWHNACDPDVGYYAQFECVLDGRTLEKNTWQEITVKFDTDAGFASVFAGDKHIINMRMRNSTLDGVSYLHLQTNAESEDFLGTYIKNFNIKGDV